MSYSSTSDNSITFSSPINACYILTMLKNKNKHLDEQSCTYHIKNLNILYSFSFECLNNFVTKDLS